MKKIIEERSLQLNRRAFLGKTALGIGGIGLASLLGTPYFNTTKNGIITSATPQAGIKGALDGLHHPAKIKGLFISSKVVVLLNWSYLIISPC